MTQITLLAEDDCLSSGISGITDALSIANLFWQYMEGNDTPLFTTQIVTPDGKPVTANGGLVLTPDASMADMTSSQIIIIPGFFRPLGLKEDRLDMICNWLRHHYSKGSHLVSTCTGTFLLGRTGLLDGKIATTNWQFAGYFKKSFPQVELRVHQIFTEDSGIYCTGATTAFMDLCLHFIEKYGNAALARRCAKSLLLDHERQEQTPYMVYDFGKTHTDNTILTSQQIMEDNYSDKISIDTLSKDLGISPRHFKRRFKKATGENPLAYLQLLRIENAKRELEMTQKTVNEITWGVGYEDINSFRKLFKKHTGMSPTEYRKRFSWAL